MTEKTARAFRRALLLATLAATGCSLIVNFDDVEGLPCDAQGGCAGGYRCVEGKCAKVAKEAGIEGRCDAASQLCAGVCASCPSGAGVASVGCLGTQCVVTACGGSYGLCLGKCLDVQNDPTNCGACGRDCLGGACQSGRCMPVVLASGEQKPLGIALDMTRVYWTESAGSRVRAAPIGGGAPATLGSGSPTYGIAVNDTSVYWTTKGPQLLTLLLSGGTPAILVPSLKATMGIALDATSLYVTDDLAASGTVTKVSFGGVAVQLAGNQDHPYAIAVDGLNVYWVNLSGSVMKIPIAGGNPVALATGQSSPKGIATDGANVYWTTQGGGTVMKVPRDGGVPVTLASGQDAPYGIVMDGAYIYWANSGATAPSIMKAPIGGGTPATLATVGKSPSFVAVDATSVYWTDPTDGTVMRVVK